MTHTVSYTLAQLAEQLQAQLLGDDGQRLIQGVATLEKAQPGQLSFLSNRKYHRFLSDTQAEAVIVGESDRDATALPRLVCANPYAAFAAASRLLNPEPEVKAGIHPSAIIGQNVTLGDHVSIGPHVVIEDEVTIGAGSAIGAGCYLGRQVCLGQQARLHPKVVIYHQCQAGDRLTVHSGAVIGADGFGIAMHEGRWHNVPQVGRVVLGDDVDVGANTTIDRGALDDTVIETGVKLDNQIQIAHNVRIGAHTAIAGCAAIAGSTVIGRYCIISGAARIIGHLTIADHVEVSAHTLVTKSITEPGTYTAHFPMARHSDWQKNAVHLRKLDNLVKRVRNLEKQSSQNKK